jgi:putative GTP pyrophosphokinase
MRKREKRKPEYDLGQLEQEYSRLRPRLVQLHDELLHQLDELLDQATVPLSFPVQHRVKAWSSISEKLQRVPLSLKSLRDLQDLVGFRILLQFRRDVDRVCALIGQSLRVISRYDTLERLKEDQFGYASVHFVVEVPQAWLAVPTMSGLADLRAEIQVRTTAQHIWAEASQTLQYKSKEAVPPALKRSIYRVSALLETVDLEFERFLADRDTYKAEVALAIPSAEALNTDILEQVLDEAWPTESKDPGEERAQLFADIAAMGVKTPGALRKLISKWHDAAMEYDKQTAALYRDQAGIFASVPSLQERIMAGRYFSRTGLTRFVLSREFPAEWKLRSPTSFQHLPTEKNDT